MVHVHALVDAARNQTAAEPAAKECNQKAGNVRNEAGRCRGLGVDLRVATGTDHVRRLGSNRNHRCDDGRPLWLGYVRHEGAGRGNATDGLCIAGRSRLGRYEAVRRGGLLAHLGIGFPFRWWPMAAAADGSLSLTVCCCKNPLSALCPSLLTRTRTFPTWNLLHNARTRIGQYRTGPRSFTQFSPNPEDPDSATQRTTDGCLLTIGSICFASSVSVCV